MAYANFDFIYKIRLFSGETLTRGNVVYRPISGDSRMSPIEFGLNGNKRLVRAECHFTFLPLGTFDNKTYQNGLNIPNSPVFYFTGFLLDAEMRAVRNPISVTPDDLNLFNLTDYQLHFSTSKPVEKPECVYGAGFAPSQVNVYFPQNYNVGLQYFGRLRCKFVFEI